MTINPHVEKRERKKNYQRLAETKADTTHTVGTGRNITKPLNVTGPVGRLLLYFPPLPVFLLSFHFLPSALVSSSVLHLFLYHSPSYHAATLVTSTPCSTLEVTIRFGMTFTELSSSKTRWTLNKGRHREHRERQPRHCREEWVSETEESRREREEKDDGRVNVIWEMASLSRSD